MSPMPSASVVGRLTITVKATHVTPVGDNIRHVTDGGYCWCSPRVETVTLKGPQPKTVAEVLVVHQSTDCRELIERHGVQ